MKNSLLKNIYLFIVILYSGMALSIFRSHEGLLFLWGLGLLIFWKETINPSKKLFYAIGIWLIYFLINTIIIRSFHPFFMMTYICKIMIAYWILTYFKYDLLYKFERIIYKLVVLSLILFLIQLIIPSQMYSIFESIDLSENLFSKINYASIGVYTFHQRELSLDPFPRNSGFCWEPGPFSLFIIFALFLNLAKNNLQFKDKRSLIIYIIALISTQSTTGFVALIALIIWYSWSRFKNKTAIIFSIPISVFLVIYLFTTVPFLQEKIIEESEQDIELTLNHASRAGTSHAPGRFASFQLRWMDFKNYPIAGFGGNSKLQVGYLGEDNVVAAISGIGNIIGRYGGIGTFLFLYLIYSSGKYFSKILKYSGHMIFPILILITGFGFGIIESPIFVSFWMYAFFLKYKTNNNENTILHRVSAFRR